MWIFIESEKGLWTVGFYDPTGKFIPQFDYSEKVLAADQCRFLNGGE